jgi:glutamate--cysteine ligase
MSLKQTGSKEILKAETLLDETLKVLIGNHDDNKEKRIGFEIEMTVVDEKTLKPISFTGITRMFNALSAAKGQWQPLEVENGNVTALHNSTGAITLEPGGQIEFAGTARKTLAEVEKDLTAYLEDFAVGAKKNNFNVVPYGFMPHVSIDECPYIDERSRFAALKPVFEAEKGYAAWGQSTSAQLTLDSISQESAFDAFRLGLAIQPVQAAMSANSPFALGEDTGFKSWRRQNLQALDSPLYAVPEAVFDKDYTIKDWAAHTLTVPMSFVVRGEDEQYISVAPKPFKDMVGKPLPELAHLPEDEQYLTLKDLKDHFTGIKPEMLLKPHLLHEARANDLGPGLKEWMGVAAFNVGIFYDKDAFKEAQEYVAQWTSEDRLHMRKNVARDGLHTEVGNTNVQQIALELIGIARKGLERIEPESAHMLDVLEDRVAKGISPADIALGKFRANNGDIDSTLRQTFLFKPANDHAQAQKPQALGL